MTKDEQIAALQETVAALREDRASMVVALQAALDRIPMEAAGPLSNTERSRMYRQRQRDGADATKCNADATPSVAPGNTDATGMQRDATASVADLSTDATKCNEMQRNGVASDGTEKATKCNENATNFVAPHGMGGATGGGVPPRSSEGNGGDVLRREGRTGDVLRGGDGGDVLLNDQLGNTTDTGHATKMQRKALRAVALDTLKAEEDAAKKGLKGDDFRFELERFTDYWDSAGWKRKSGPVKDRNATWRTWLNSPFRSTNGAKGKHDNQQVIDEWSRQWAGEAEVIEVAG